MSSAEVEPIGVDVETKLENSDHERGLDLSDTDEKSQFESIVPQAEDEGEDKSEADEDMEDLFGDDKDVEEVKREGYVYPCS